MKKLIISLSAILLFAAYASAQDEGRKSGDAPAASKYSVPELTIRERVVGDVLILDLEGEFEQDHNDTQSGAAALNRAIQESVNAGRANILLNFKGVRVIHSEVQHAMIAGSMAAERLGGKLKLENTVRIVEELRLKQLLTEFEVYDNEEEALKSFASATD